MHHNPVLDNAKKSRIEHGALANGLHDKESLLNLQKSFFQLKQLAPHESSLVAENSSHFVQSLPLKPTL
jgi:hypothetical protein